LEGEKREMYLRGDNVNIAAVEETKVLTGTGFKFED